MTAVVSGQGARLGIITDGDIRRAFRGGFIDQPATEVVRPNPRSASRDLLAQEALALMTKAQNTSL